VANAGLQQDAPFDQMTLRQWKRVIDGGMTLYPGFATGG
jgi:NADP-dependent 3-hydroxy acid dehydrogenase YdfG